MKVICLMTDETLDGIHQNECILCVKGVFITFRCILYVPRNIVWLDRKGPTKTDGNVKILTEIKINVFVTATGNNCLPKERFLESVTQGPTDEISLDNKIEGKVTKYTIAYCASIAISIYKKMLVFTAGRMTLFSIGYFKKTMKWRIFLTWCRLFLARRRVLVARR